MGLKTIEAEYKTACAELESTFGAFLKDARQINSVLGRLDEINASLAKAQDDLQKDLKAAESQAKGLKTHNIVQLEEMKSLLVAACAAIHHLKPVKLNEIEALDRQCKKEIELEKATKLTEITEKRAAAFPKKIEPGMTFKPRAAQYFETFEILKLVKGGMLYDVKLMRGDGATATTTVPVSSVTPKNYKFLKT